MEENQGNQKKPLRQSSNKIKDLYDTYVKNEGRQIPIKDSEEEENQPETAEQAESQEASAEEHSEEPKGEQEIFEELTSEINRLRKEKEELREQSIRKAAEMENLRKRSNREKQDMLEYANEKLLAKMLELLDDINSAVDAGKKSQDYDALLKGVEMISAKAEKLFADAGVKPMPDPKGEDFDVDYHEALMHMPSDLPEGKVVQAVQRGYMLKDKVLRHAKVITSAGNEQESEN
jgi:molecular chaperone GrpE